jgi:hypothetical protein
MCERCRAWEIVITDWFGESLLRTLNGYVDQCLATMERNELDQKRIYTRPMQGRRDTHRARNLSSITV